MRMANECQDPAPPSRPWLCSSIAWPASRSLPSSYTCGPTAPAAWGSSGLRRAARRTARTAARSLPGIPFLVGASARASRPRRWTPDWHRLDLLAQRLVEVSASRAAVRLQVWALERASFVPWPTRLPRSRRLPGIGVASREFDPGGSVLGSWILLEAG